MSDDTVTKVGLGNGRSWSAMPADGRSLTWSLDPQQGLVQGPLDLGFLRGQKLALDLEPGQLALLIAEDNVRAVYLDGNHFLDIGHGAQQVSPDWHLIFLAPGEGLTMRWSSAAPLCWGQEVHQAVIGTCGLEIDRPEQFYNTFVAGAEACDDAFLKRLVEQIIRGMFEDMLGGRAGESGPQACADLQARLTSLEAADLNDDLAPYGLTCRHLAVYTAQPPVGADDQAQSGVHSQDDLQTSGHFDGVGHN